MHVSKALNQMPITVEVPDWQAGVYTETTPTYQTSINPLYRMDSLGPSNISKVVFENMKHLNADYMRHVPWYPYPRLAVAELAEPSGVGTSDCSTSWYTEFSCLQFKYYKL